MAKLKPKEKAYYAHFSAGAHTVSAAAQAVSQLAGPGADRAAIAGQLASLAESADAEYQSVLNALRASFITPFDRTEIQALSRELAAVVRRLETTAALVHLLDPRALPDEFGSVARLVAQAAEATEEAIGKLRKLKGIKHHHEAMRTMAAEAECHRRLLLVRLAGGQIDPLDAITLHAISDELAAAVTAVVDVAEVVETVLITEG